MIAHRRLAVTEIGDVTVVRFVDRRLLDEANIQELGWELFQLVDEEDREQLLLNFVHVEFLSSSALGKLIMLYRKLKARGGTMKLSNVRPEVYDIIAITNLTSIFDIHDEEVDALEGFEDNSPKGMSTSQGQSRSPR